jgi:hypothetical protein
MQQVKFRFVGVMPMLINGDRLANPLDPATKAHKKVATKRAKTDDDHEWLLRSEYVNGLYWDKKVGPYMPGQNIDSALISAAKLQRLGEKFAQGVRVIDDACPLVYDGPREPEKLYEAAGFRDVRSCVMQKRRVMRCRARFAEWALTCTVAFNERVVNRDQLIEAAHAAGELIGLGTFRRRFGRFAVEVVK